MTKPTTASSTFVQLFASDMSDREVPRRRRRRGRRGLRLPRRPASRRS
ncbi:hypothetical protein HBB16_04345 [Pseudonocardia sp. MCCB 268]|nr:hypothetical protein [Pseudonocardia cytotoxica]